MLEVVQGLILVKIAICVGGFPVEAGGMGAVRVFGDQDIQGPIS